MYIYKSPWRDTYTCDFFRIKRISLKSWQRIYKKKTVRIQGGFFNHDIFHAILFSYLYLDYSFIQF